MFTALAVIAAPAWSASSARLARVDALQDAGSDSAHQATGTSDAASDGASDVDPLQAFRAPLLRQGSTLVEAPAHMQRDAAQNWWMLVLDRSDSPSSSSSAPGRELVLLPCTRLSEMERIIEATPGGDVRFHVTGRIYVYRDRNYFLPSHASVINAAQPTISAAPAPATIMDMGAVPTPTPRSSISPSSESARAASTSKPDADDSAESIARALEQEAGPIARSSASGRSHRPVPSPTAGADAKTGRPSTMPNVSQAPTQFSASTLAGAAAGSHDALQENTAVVNRRGKIIRDRSGGWLLVLDADASALADPPLRLLPCMLLENIEDYARRSGNNSPIIITGQVCLYNGQNFLLPTVYRIPRERSRLTP